jgi:hypothetical protein
VFGKLVDELLALGAGFSAIEAGLSNAEQMEEEIWDKAIVNARERAEKTLTNAGMKLPRSSLCRQSRSLGSIRIFSDLLLAVWQEWIFPRKQPPPLLRPSIASHL